jgi:hypothetical protein
MDTDKGMDRGTDRATDRGTDKGSDDSDGMWLTYAELAAIRRIDRHSAVKLVIRHGWRRQKDNRGVLRIFVPSDWAKGTDKGTDKTPDMGTDGSTDAGTDMSSAISALEASVSSLTARAEAAEKRTDQAEIRADRAETRADQAYSRAELAEKRTDRAEQAMADERNRANHAEHGRDAERASADALRDRLITMQEQLADAHGALQAAEATAARADRAERDKEQAEAGREDERARAGALLDQVQGLVTQLTTLEADARAANDRAWAAGEAAGALREQVARLEQRIESERTRADRAEASAAHERQDFLDAESRTRRELDGVRQRLERTEESGEAAAELHRQVEAAQIAQAEAEADAAELRQAEAARQGRGRWARLRAAWRGG